MAVTVVFHPSLLDELVLPLSYAACVVVSHRSYGDEYTLYVCQPSVASAVVLLALYWACVTVVHDVLVAVCRVRQPSLLSGVELLPGVS